MPSPTDVSTILMADSFSFSFGSALLQMSIFWLCTDGSEPNLWSSQIRKQFDTLPNLTMPTISNDLKDLILRMLEKNPNTRITVPEIKVK
ncbi:hypothetical protein Z043_124051 [Scleropages formosus]|uniref:Protein kinase domain-containing protein n=1 Tax=Scleropages formosus TaxID=113540 RepID=A0A0P7UCU0_SCLFO|nr:hypothetical protein Z043_124051 [Scleropages formosus]